MEGILLSVFVVFLAPHSIDTRPQIAKKKGDTEKLIGVAISSTCSQQLLGKKKTEAAQRFSLAFGEGRKRRKTLAWLLIRKAEEYQGLRGHTVRMYVCLSIALGPPFSFGTNYCAYCYSKSGRWRHAA